MFNYKSIIKKALCLIFILILSANFSGFVAFAETKEVYLGGFPAGFVLNTTTVQVVGVCDVMTEEGMKSPARDCGIKSGDIIKKINENEIDCVLDVNNAIEGDYKSLKIEILRNNQNVICEASSVRDLTSGKKRLGLLVKDSLNGIGTITYIDMHTNKFASLGHPVIDTNNKLQEINGGSVYSCFVYDVKKGVRGNPGELRGVFKNDNMIGTVEKNTYSGVFGSVSTELNVNNLEKIETSNISDVNIGKAQIYSTVGGNKRSVYDITIVKIDKNNKDNRNFVIKIEDEDLLEKTGGIVQGMSGSPIVQNGKLVGAVTHVFVNDPTRGFGISIDKMI